MSDSIHINQLEIRAHVGVPEQERRQSQRLLISLVLKVASLRSAALTDDLATSVDYAAVCDRVQAVAAERPRKLIETLAEELARAVLMGFAPVQEIVVEIEKFILADTRSVAVRIKRKLSAKDAKKRLRAGPSDTPPISGAHP